MAKQSHLYYIHQMMNYGKAINIYILKVCSSVIGTNQLHYILFMTLQGTHKNLIYANSNINLSFHVYRLT